MRIVIVGVTGSIGSWVAAALAESGNVIVGLARDSDRAQRSLPFLEKAQRWDVMSGPAPSEAFEGVDAVLNFAGAAIHGRWSAAKKQLMYDSRVRGTERLVQGIANSPSKPKVLINGNAIGYYGHRGDEELTETSPPGDDFLANLCKDWEAAAAQAETSGVRVSFIRTSFVISNAKYGIMASLLPMARLGLGGPLGSGRQWWPWIHIADYAGLVQHILDNSELAGPFNGASPNPARQRDLARTLGRVLRRPAVLPVPSLALRMVLGEFAGEVLNSRRVLPKAALDSGFAFRFSELEPTFRDILGK